MPVSRGIPKRAGRSGRPWSRVVERLKREAPSICAICGRDIDMTLRHPDPWSWTADHEPSLKVLVANGLDPNDIQYLRPAHKRCNEVKGSGPSPMPLRSSKRW